MKHLQHNQEFQLNEILFENRNKNYGAYVLRNESDKILTKALFLGVSLMAAVAITPLVISAFNPVEKVVPFEPVYRPVDILPNDVEKPKPEVVKPIQPVSPPNVKQYDDRLAIPTRNADESNIIKEIPKDAVAGTVNNLKGDPVTMPTYQPVAPTIGAGPITPSQPPAIETTKDPNAIEVASVEAKFEGGIESFRNKVMNKFDGSGFESDNVMKTTVTFIVEKDGTISGLKADGKDVDFNSEALRTIKAVKGKWIPGKNKKGEPVRSYFKFPISMKFES